MSRQGVRDLGTSGVEGTKIPFWKSRLRGVEAWGRGGGQMWDHENSRVLVRHHQNLQPGTFGSPSLFNMQVT